MLSLAPLGKVHDPPFELNLLKSLSSKDVSWVEIGLVILQEMQNVKNLWKQLSIRTKFTWDFTAAAQVS